MAYPLRRPWLFKLKKTNIKSWNDIYHYKFKPSFMPKMKASLLPFLILYFKILKLNSFNFKIKFFQRKFNQKIKQKSQYFYLLFLICSNRILVLFFFKLQYMWLMNINGFLLENQFRLWIIFLIFLKLDYKKYLFNVTYFDRELNEKVIDYKNFKWRVSLRNFFSFGRYIEYIRRIKYNEYLANMFNYYSVNSRIYRISQFRVNKMPEALAIDHKFQLINVLDYYCIYIKRGLKKNYKKRKNIEILNCKVLNFSFWSVQFFCLQKIKKLYVFLFFVLSSYYKSYIVRALNLCIYSLKIWLSEWIRFRYNNIRRLFLSLRLYYRRILVWFHNYCVLAFIRLNFGFLHTKLIFKTIKFSFNFLKNCNLIMVEYISSLYIMWYRFLQMKRRSRKVTYPWRVIFFLIKTWYHVLVIDLVNMYDSRVFNYILNLVKYNFEYIWWRISYAGHVKKVILTADRNIFMKYSIFHKYLNLNKFKEFSIFWLFLKKKYFQIDFIWKYFFQEVLFDLVFYFLGFSFYSLFKCDIVESSYFLNRLLIWVRRLEWFKCIYLDNFQKVHYYIEPFERLLDEIYFFVIQVLI